MDDRTRAMLPYIAVAVLCGAIGLYLAMSQGGEAKLQRASDEVGVGRPADALRELDGVRGQVDGRAAAVRGHAFADRRQFKLAVAEYAKAVRYAPNDWRLQREYAIVLRAAGKRAAARARMQRALALNPRMQLPQGFRAVKRQRRTQARR